jgi:hypothetical protein
VRVGMGGGAGGNGWESTQVGWSKASPHPANTPVPSLHAPCHTMPTALTQDRQQQPPPKTCSPLPPGLPPPLLPQPQGPPLPPQLTTASSTGALNRIMRTYAVSSGPNPNTWTKGERRRLNMNCG